MDRFGQGHQLEKILQDLSLSEDDGVRPFNMKSPAERGTQNLEKLFLVRALTVVRLSL